MSSFQRVIKYCAIAFAVFLAVSIISGIASAVFAVVTAISGVSYMQSDARLTDFSKDFENVRSVDINHSLGELNIKTGDTFRVEGINVPNEFRASISMNGTLNVSERRTHFPWFNIGNFKHRSIITIYLPENFIAEDTKIESGFGNVTIDALHTQNLKISGGAGNITGNNISAENDSNINGGMGNITLNNVNFNDAAIDGGVGNINIDGKLLGDNKIGCGVGEIQLSLLGNKDNYNFNVDTGVGLVRINGEKIQDNYYDNSNADNKIKIDGGVGNVNIDFNE